MMAIKNRILEGKEKKRLRWGGKERGLQSGMEREGKGSGNVEDQEQEKERTFGKGKRGDCYQEQKTAFEAEMGWQGKFWEIALSDK